MRSLRTFLPKSLLGATSLALAGTWLTPAHAATSTWVGDTSNLWNTGANWSGGTVPASGSTLFFGNPGAAGSTLSDDITSLSLGGNGVDGIVFGPGAAGYTIARASTQTITLGSSGMGVGIKDISYFLQTLSVPLAYTSDQTIQVGTNSGAALSSLSLTGAQTGAFRLIKTGNGLLTLGNSLNTFSGLTVNGGTVNIQLDGNLGTAPSTATAGSIVLNGGVLRAQVNTAFTINANRGIALGDATAGSGGTINVYATGGTGTAVTYNGVIANNGGSNYLVKTGTLNLILGGANTYTGATKINQGQLTLDFTQTGAPTSNILSGSSSLVMGDVPTALQSSGVGSPTLFVQGSNTGATSQTLNGATFNPGNSSVVARGGSSTFDTTLNLGAVTHNVGATVGFSQLTGGSTGQGVITTTTANTNGILGGWATTAGVSSGSTAATQTDWATNVGGNIVAYTGYTDYVTAGGVASNAASNFRITSASTGTLTLSAGTTDLNTIQLTDTVNRVIAVGAGNTLRLGSYGGVWKTAALNTSLTIGTSTALGGTLTAGGAANTAGEIVFNTNGAATTNATIVVNSAIADNGTGAVSVVKTGSAILTLNGNNTYSGGTYINQGTVYGATANAFGGAGKDVTILPGGVVNLTSATPVTYANNFNIAGSSALILNGNTASGKITLLADAGIGAASSSNGGTVSGQITGDYNLIFMSNVTTLTNTANDYSGNLGINGITGALGSATVTVKLGADEVLSNGAGKGNVIISGGNSGVAALDLNGKTETINGLVSASTVANVRVTNSAATAASLTLGDNDQSATFAGTIVDGSGSVAITKIGKGVQTFGGANTYTGATTISAGTLLLTAAGSIDNSTVVNLGTAGSKGTLDVTAKSSYTFGTNQTVAGFGTINLGAGKVVTVNGNLAPGNSAGVVSVIGDLALGSTATTTMELADFSTGAGTGFDQVGVSGALTFGGVLSINVTGATALGAYDLFDFASESGTFSAINFSSGAAGTFDYTTGVLNLTAVPEPSTWALLGGAGLFLLMRRRRMA